MAQHATTSLADHRKTRVKVEEAFFAVVREIRKERAERGGKPSAAGKTGAKTGKDEGCKCTLL